MVVQCNESIHIVHIHIFISITTNKLNKEKTKKRENEKYSNSCKCHFFLSQSRHAMVFWTRYSVKSQCSASESPQRQSFPSLSLERQNVSRRPSERNSNLCQSCKVYIPIPWSPPIVFYAACVCACECMRVFR